MLTTKFFQAISPNSTRQVQLGLSLIAVSFRTSRLFFSSKKNKTKKKEKFTGWWGTAVSSELKQNKNKNEKHRKRNNRIVTCGVSSDKMQTKTY